MVWDGERVGPLVGQRRALDLCLSALNTPMLKHADAWAPRLSTLLGAWAPQGTSACQLSPLARGGPLWRLSPHALPNVLLHLLRRSLHVCWHLACHHFPPFPRVNT